MPEQDATCAASSARDSLAPPLPQRWHLSSWLQAVASTGAPSPCGVRFKDHSYSRGNAVAQYQKLMAAGPESISSPMKPRRRHAMNSDKVAKHKLSFANHSRRKPYTVRVRQRAISTVKLTRPPPSRTSRNIEWA